MRTLLAAFMAAAVLAVAAGAAPAPPAAPAPAPPAAPEAAPAAAPDETGVRNEEMRFDRYVENQKAGHVCLKVMTAGDAAIIDEELVAPYRGQEASFDSKIVYRGAGKPAPQSAKVNTRFGTLNVMTGTLTFTAAGGKLAVKQEATGFTDKDHRPLTKPLVSSQDSAAPGGLILTYAAFLHFAPRLLPAAGQIDNVVYTEFPASIEFPALVKFNPGATLSRAAETADGQSEFMIKRVYPGGNFIPIAVMTIDKQGRVVEARTGQSTLVPEGAKPKPREPVKEPAKK